MIGRSRLAIDALRGIAILVLIVSDHLTAYGAWPEALRRSGAVGASLADLAAGCLFFTVGAALPEQLSRRAEAGAARGALIGWVLRTSVCIGLLGLLLSAWPVVTWAPEFGWHPSWVELQLPDLLQQVAICFALVATAYLFVAPRRLVPLAMLVLLVAWGFDGARPALAAHELLPPVGLLDLIPALAVTAFGVAAGRRLQGSEEPVPLTARIAVPGILLLFAAGVWSWWLPITVEPWSGSFGVLSAGLSAQALALAMWLIDVRAWRRVAGPLAWVGAYALLWYAAAGIAAESVALWVPLAP